MNMELGPKNKNGQEITLTDNLDKNAAEKWWGYLRESLEAVTSSEIEDETQKTKDEDVAFALRSLLEMKQKGTGPVLENLAKNHLHEIGALRMSMRSSRRGIDNEYVHTSLGQMLETVEYLARSKYPEDVKRQNEARDEATKDEIERMRERLKNVKIS